MHASAHQNNTFKHLGKAYQKLQQRKAEFLKRYDLTIQQFVLLQLVKHSHPKPVSVKYLKKEMPDRVSDVSRIVERMRKKDLLSRASSEVDRRSVQVSITGKGLGILYEITQSTEYLNFQEVPNLSRQEMEMLDGLLQKIVG